MLLSLWNQQRKNYFCVGSNIGQIKIIFKRRENILYMIDETSEWAMKASYASSHLIALHSKFLVWKASSFKGGWYFDDLYPV
jgi:hypothetical protein